MLRRSKTDQADAALLARFCQRERPEPWSPPSEQARELRRLTRAIDAMKRDRDRTRNRHSRSHGAAREAFSAMLAAYAEQIAMLERSVEAHMAAHPELAEQRDLLVSIPGIGAQTAALVLAERGRSDPRRGGRRALYQIRLFTSAMSWRGAEGDVAIWPDGCWTGA